MEQLEKAIEALNGAALPNDVCLVYDQSTDSICTVDKNGKIIKREPAGASDRSA